MISISKTGTHLSGNMIKIVAIMIIAFSCTKSKNNAPDNNGVKTCGGIAWSNLDQSGSFTISNSSGSYRLIDATHTENGVTGEYKPHYDSNGHLLNDLEGITYTYTGDNLTTIAVTDAATEGNGTGEYDFDSNGHLKTAVIDFTSSGFTGVVNARYDYDENEDPVLFNAGGTISTSDGPMNIKITISGDFLKDKSNFLPFMPILAPATSYFSFIPFTSKHLLNKWEVSIYINDVPKIHYIIQYTYTYDSNGNIATMVNTGNSSNVYKFTYSNCN